MIRAVELVKRYAAAVALDGVSFEARPGEVLGLLGPNGAGKTTTLRLLAGYLAPSAGRAEVCGIDVAVDPLRARAQLGYLPENVPLYPELRVEEYLRYRAALKGVPRGERARSIEEATARVGVSDVRRRVIGQLSKGYRQRVGLADALLHGPAALILDEPTDGLDPNQRRDVLALIRTLGRERTVVLSTHILPEVEAICDRVVILDRGRVIAVGRPAELERRGAHLRVVARGPREALLAAIRAVQGVEQVAVVDPPKGAEPPRGRGPAESNATQAPAEGPEADQVLEIRSAGDRREAIARAVCEVGGLRELGPATPGLDQVFQRLTRPPEAGRGLGASDATASPPHEPGSPEAT